MAQKATQDLAVELDETLRELDNLAPKHRNILVLTCIHELSYARTARRLKIPLGTVRSRLSRARAELLATVNGQRGDRCNGEGPTIPTRSLFRRSVSKTRVARQRTPDRSSARHSVSAAMAS